MKRIVVLGLLSFFAIGFAGQTAVAQTATKKSQADKTPIKAAASTATNTADSPVLVRVNGRPITEADLQFFVKTRQLNAEDIEVRREVLIERLIERQLLRAFLAQKKIAADARLLQEHVTRIKLRLKEQGEDFEKVLAKVGLNEDSLRRELSLPLDWDAYAKQIVTDAQVREVWKERSYEFDGSEVWASHIVLQSDQPAADENSLREIRKQITTGKLSFPEAAKKYSHPEAPSRSDGGKLGRFGFRGKQPPPYPQIAFGLKIGEVSEPFRSPFGVHILIVTERAAGQLSLEDARPEIQHQLSVELQEEVLKQERLKAKIESLR